MITHNTGEYLLKGLDNWIRQSFVSRMPQKVTTQVLTLSTLIWSLMVILLGVIIRHDFHYIYLLSLVVLVQHFTDVLDGAVGRHRNNGLINWGFYMDHLMDFVFASSLIYSFYLFMPPTYDLLLLGVYIVLIAFMIHSFLMSAIRQNFQCQYHGFGTTEIKILFVVASLVAPIFGLGFVIFALKVAFMALLLFFVLIVNATQKELLADDIKTNSRNP